MVLCVSEVPDGSAQSMIEQASLELEKLCDIAHALNTTWPTKNWLDTTSSTSDSASTQKHLVEQCRERDEEAMDPLVLKLLKLLRIYMPCILVAIFERLSSRVWNTCIQDEAVADLSAQQREHDHTDTFIHEFCIVFGKHGVPEYNCGNLTFPNF